MLYPLHQVSIFELVSNGRSYKPLSRQDYLYLKYYARAYG